jgi:hypothetical protein
VNFEGEDSVHNVAGAFKLYLRSLEEPVLPFDFHDDAIKISTLAREGNNAPQALLDTQALFAKLPELNRKMWDRIFQLLITTAQKR